MIIEGAISVKAAIASGKRDIREVYISIHKKTKDFNYIRKIAREQGIPVRELEEPDLLTVLSGKTHGGIGADVSGRREDAFTDGDILFLDGIEDPFNLGYVLRTAYAFGIVNVYLPERDYSMMESQLLKSSAGAYDHLNIRLFRDIEELKDLKRRGYPVYTLYRGEEPEDVFTVDFPSKAVYVIGGEKRGIRREILDLSDHNLYISYGSGFRNALNAAAAADVLLTLIRKGRIS